MLSYCCVVLIKYWFEVLGSGHRAEALLKSYKLTKY
jgi:hypothetical protein